MLRWLILCLVTCDQLLLGHSDADAANVTPPEGLVGANGSRWTITLVAQSGVGPKHKGRLNRMLLPSLYSFWDMRLGPLHIFFDASDYSSDVQQQMLEPLYWSRPYNETYRLRSNPHQSLWKGNVQLTPQQQGWVESQYSKFFTDLYVDSDVIGCS